MSVSTKYNIVALLGVTPLEMAVPQIANMVIEITDWVSNYEDGAKVLRQVLRNAPGAKRLDFVYQYMCMRKDYDKVLGELKMPLSEKELEEKRRTAKRMKNELSLYE